jgi:hypothetical protein
MIDRRLPGLALLLLAAILYGSIALPARRAAAVAEAELLRVRAEGEPLRQRVAEALPRRAAEEAWRRERRGRDRTVVGLRRELLRVAGKSVSGVRLSVSPASAPLAARARFAAVGSFADLVALSERLIGPETGLVPERLRFSLADPELRLELDAVVLADVQ